MDTVDRQNNIIPIEKFLELFNEKHPKTEVFEGIHAYDTITKREDGITIHFSFTDHETHALLFIQNDQEIISENIFTQCYRITVLDTENKIFEIHLLFNELFKR